jgi:acyl dehydratase
MVETSHPLPWSVVARNLPEHARNPIHTDAGARASGFDRALVAGVTSYAYCCHPVLERFGLGWVASGEAEVRFRSPVSDGERLSFRVAEREGGGLDVAAVPEGGERSAVEVSALLGRRGRVEQRPGERLALLKVRLEGEYGSGYAAKAGDDLPLCADAGVVHPAVWPALANDIFHNQLARGAWVHTRSVVRHFALVPAGAEAEVSTVVVRRWWRRGERAVADVMIRVEDEIVATVEHEAIIDLAGGEPGA